MQVKKSCILQRYVEIKLKIMLFYVCSYLYAGSYLQIRQSVYACVRVTDEQKLGDCAGPSQLCAQIIGVPCYTEYLNAYLFLLCIVYAAFSLHTSSNICTVSKSTSFILRKNHPKFNAVKTALRRHMQSVSPHWAIFQSTSLLASHAQQALVRGRLQSRSKTRVRAQPGK